MEFVGVDVSKRELVVSDGSKCWRVPNTKAGIASLIRRLTQGTAVAMESTAGLHVALADAGHQAGLAVYVLNPKNVKRYREALTVRGKTDPLDAEVIARLLASEHQHLRRYHPLPKELKSLRTMLLRRSRLVSSKGRIRQSLEGCPELKAEMNGILARIDKALHQIDSIIETLVHGSESFTRLTSIPGVGRLIGAGLLAALQRGEFHSADAFVAFLGLDLLANDSGQKKGRRRLSKLGDSETRRLLYNAAMAAARTQAWNPIYQRYRERLSTTAALVALSRRIARTAWSIFTYRTNFQLERLSALT